MAYVDKCFQMFKLLYDDNVVCGAFLPDKERKENVNPIFRDYFFFIDLEVI